MTAPHTTPAAGDNSGRPEGGNTLGESMLSCTAGAGPNAKEICVVPQQRPARPVRFADPERDRAYWERIERNTAAAPPLSDEQKAIIRAAFHGSRQREAA